MAIKDILQSLVDDAMVDTDKVGSANYYWAFPSKASISVRETAADMERWIATERLQEWSLCILFQSRESIPLVANLPLNVATKPCVCLSIP